MRPIYNPKTNREKYAVDRSDLDVLFGTSYYDLRGLQASYFLSGNEQFDFSEAITLDDKLFQLLGEIKEWWLEHVDTLMNQEATYSAKQTQPTMCGNDTSGLPPCHYNIGGFWRTSRSLWAGVHFTL